MGCEARFEKKNGEKNENVLKLLKSDLYCWVWNYIANLKLCFL